MGEQTAISWCDHTFNPWIGCTKIAPACDGCYAAHLMDTRLGRVKWDGPPVRTSAGNWYQPLKWNEAAAYGNSSRRKPFVFCASLADVFDNQADPAWRADLFELIRNTPYLVWLLLTKRPQNIIKMSIAATDDADGPALPRNAAIGTTCEDQEHADINLLHLRLAKLTLNPAFAFVSIEPMLGPIDLTCIPWPKFRPRFPENDDISDGFDALRYAPGNLDWVITGGETDQGAHKARPTHPQWFRDIRDQCAAAGVPYHHKQNGEWLPACWTDDAMEDAIYTARDERHPEATRRCKVENSVMHSDGSLHDHNEPMAFISGAMSIFKVGKRRSGRTIDGVTHDAFPEVRT